MRELEPLHGGQTTMDATKVYSIVIGTAFAIGAAMLVLRFFIT